MVDDIITQCRDKMLKAVEITKQDLTTIRSGRATPALVETINITAYNGTQLMKLREMATITTADAKTLLIAPFDPSTIHDIERGILESSIGLTPSRDGEVIRISIPPLTEERRNEYIKLARTKAEAGRIMIRQARREAMEKTSRSANEKLIDEDTKYVYEKKIQKLTDDMIQRIDDMLKKKEEEVSQV